MTSRLARAREKEGEVRQTKPLHSYHVYLSSLAAFFRPRFSSFSCTRSLSPLMYRRTHTHTHSLDSRHTDLCVQRMKL